MSGSRKSGSLIEQRSDSVAPASAADAPSAHHAAPSHPNRLPGEVLNKKTSIPFAVFHLTPLVLIFTGVSKTAVILGLVTYWTRMFFITAGYHRYFSHRAFKTSRAFQFLLAFGGTTATQKGPLWWAGHHRMHHRETDTVADVHSPIKGLWWSHVGWILSDATSPTPEGAINDFQKFPELRFLNRFDFIGPWMLGITCFLVGGWSGLVVGYFVSTILLWHSTFMVNSVAHLWGTRRYATKDSSRNNLFVALITMGEGWHNNHHHIASSARQGFKWWEIDLSYYVLVVLSWFKIVSGLKHPPAKVKNTALIKDGAYDIGMFRFHWDKATTRVASAVASPEWEDARVALTQSADHTLSAAHELGRVSRQSPEVQASKIQASEVQASKVQESTNAPS